MGMAQRNDDLARELVKRASAAGLTISIAESLTAGLVSATIADIPGSSAVLKGGAVTYWDEVKHRVLGVSLESLDRYSAVSEAVAREMAAGSRSLFESDIAVSLTGYAGPDGGTEEDPVGTVYLGVSTARGTRVVRCRFDGDRAAVRFAACAKALELLLLTVAQLP